MEGYMGGIKKEHIAFTEIPSTTKKTKDFIITTADLMVNLAHIKWYAPWRRYCFFPRDNTIFDTTCLKKIYDFIDKLMAERSKERKRKIK